MSNKNVSAVVFLVFGVLLSQVCVGQTIDCTSLGRESLFDGTVSGLRDAYLKFEESLNEGQCENDRELIFLHALTRITMWVLKDDGGSTDSAVELAREYDVELMGDYFSDLEIHEPGYDIQVNKHDSYDLPGGISEIIDYLLNFINDVALGVFI